MKIHLRMPKLWSRFCLPLRPMQLAFLILGLALHGAVAQSSPPRFLEPGYLLLYSEGEQVDYQIPIAGGFSRHLEAMDLPEGLTLNGTSLKGQLSAGFYTPRFRVSDDYGSAEMELKIRVSPAIWQPLESGTTNTIRASAVGDGFYLLAGEGGYIATSVDGLEWQVQNSGTTADLTAAAWGAGRMVVCGTNGIIVTSVDGKFWSTTEIDPTAQIKGIVYGPPGFVADGFSDEGRIFLTSSDGLVWEEFGPPPESRRFGRMAYGHGRYIAGLASLAFLKSENGIDWRIAPSWALGVVAAVADGFVGANNTRINFSADGETWHFVDSPPFSYRSAPWVVSTSEGIVISPATTKISFSRDGIHWTHRSGYWNSGGV